jgi:hypothetical protein
MGEQIKTYFSLGIGRITAFVPELLSALAILAVGWGLSRLLASLTQRLLMRVRFDRFMTERVHARSAGRSPSEVVGSVVFWLGMLISFSLAARALHLDALATGINRILEYLPQVFVAAIIVAIGIGVANLVARLLEGTVQPPVVKAARVAIIVLASFMALDELGVARGIVMTIFAFALGSAAVAAAIAFGVGNRQLAGEYTRR